MLFYRFRLENKLLGGNSHIYQGNFSDDGVTEIVHDNQRKFEVDEAYENFNVELVDNQDAYVQIENDEAITASCNEDETDDSQKIVEIYTQKV